MCARRACSEDVKLLDELLLEHEGDVEGFVSSLDDDDK
jgi:hypothetical protein